MPDPKPFNKIKSERYELNKKRQLFNQSVKNNSEYSRYEQNRIKGKQGLKNMLLYYRGLEKGDSELGSIMENLDKLAEMNTTSDGGFWDEAVSFKNLTNQMNRYLNTLQMQEKALAKQAKDQLYRNGKWLTEQEISRDENLQRIDRELSLKQNEIENKQFLISDLKVFMERQSLGLLEVEIPFDPKKETGKAPLTEQDHIKMDWIFDPSKAPGSNDNIPHRIRGAKPVVNPPSRHINGVGKMVDSSDNRMFLDKNIPLFPHEPCLNDITQGSELGDCFLLAPIASIARSYPEKIKEMMHDNGDGTVTVRLYGKDAEGKYEPVFVTVDKVIEDKGLSLNNAEHSVWVAVLERAVAISGLYANPKHRFNSGYSPVPDNVDAIYQALKEKQDAGLLKGDALKKAVKTYPWVFTTDLLQNPVLKQWPFIDTLNGGHPGQAGEILLGPGYKFVYFEPDEARKKGVKDEQLKDDAYDMLKFYTDRDLPVFAGSKLLGHLLVPMHAYSVLKAYEKDGQRYVRLRNPWGTNTNPIVSRLAEGVSYVDADNGIFDITIEAFCKDFDLVQANGLDIDEIRYDISQPKKPGEVFELSDPDIISDRALYSNYLTLAPFASLSDITGDSNVSLNYPEGDFYPIRKWAENLSREIQKDPNNKLEINNDEFVPDLTEFRNKLLEKLESCFPDNPGSMTQLEIMESIDKTLASSRDELLAGGNEKYKGVREYVIDQIRDTNKRIQNQLKAGKLPGEEELDTLYKTFEEKSKNSSEHEILYHSKFYADKPNDFLKIDYVYRDKGTGIRMAKKNGRVVPFRSVLRVSDALLFKDLRYEAGKGTIQPGDPLPPKPQLGKASLDGELNYDSFMEYKKVLADIDMTLAAEKGLVGKSSEESVALRNALKDVQASIAGKCPIGFDTIQQQMDRLTAPLDAYEAHCAANPRNLKRRENRLKACGMLRNLQQSARDRKPDPIETVRKDYAKRLVNAAGLVQKKSYTNEEAAAIAEKLLQNPQFRGFINNQNVFHMQHATQREINKDLKAMTNKVDKDALKSDKKAVEKITEAGPGNVM